MTLTGTAMNRERIQNTIDKNKTWISTLKRLEKDLIEEGNTNDLVNCQAKIAKCQEKLDNFATQYNLPAITDHAIIRYLERHYNIDMNAIKNEILTDTVRSLMEFSDNKKMTIKQADYKLIVENNTIITLITPTL